MSVAVPRSALNSVMTSIARSAGRVAWRTYTGENAGILLIAMLVIVAIFGVWLREEGFFTLANFLNISSLSAPIIVMAVAMVFVISSGEIDLSIATVIPVAALIAAVLLSKHYNFILAALIAIAFGAGVGLVNGLVTVLFRIPSFVVTLGMLGILQGLAQKVTNTFTISIDNLSFLYWFGQGSVGPIPVLDVWALLALVVGLVVLSWTALGRKVLATGANPNAARFSGIRTGRIKVGALVATGIAGALAGLLYDGQYAAGSFTMGGSDLLTVFAATIIGGTSLLGGKGSVAGAVMGALLIGMLNNALILINLGAPEQLMARGIIVVIAVMASSRPVARRRVWSWLAALEGHDVDAAGRPPQQRSADGTSAPDAVAGVR
jgi:ribose transport system permease protein